MTYGRTRYHGVMACGWVTIRAKSDPSLPRILARFALLAALVFTQALYAGHAWQHDTDQQADCQICMQASAGMGGLPCESAGPAISAIPTRSVPAVAEPGHGSTLSFSHPSRAPPIL